MRTSLIAAATFVTSLIATHPAQALTVYRIQPIPSVPSSPNVIMTAVQPNGINSAGVVVGQEAEVGFGGVAHAQLIGVVWNGTSRALSYAFFNGINDANICAGALVGNPQAGAGARAMNCMTTPYPTVLYATSNARVTVDVGAVAPVQTGVSSSATSALEATNSTANAVNASGQIVGKQHIVIRLPASGSTSTSIGNLRETSRAYIATANSARDLGALLGGAASTATALNAAGVVVGWSEFGSIDNRSHHAFRWQAGSGMVDLGTLGGTESEATGINDAGQVVGFAQNQTQQKHAVVWNGTTVKDLGTLGGAESRALGVNGNRVIGTSLTGSGLARAFLYDLASNTMSDLNTLLPANSGWILTEARAVNASGSVVGMGTLNGVPQGFILSSLNVATATQLILAPAPRAPLTK